MTATLVNAVTAGVWAMLVFALRQQAPTTRKILKNISTRRSQWSRRRAFEPLNSNCVQAPVTSVLKSFPELQEVTIAVEVVLYAAGQKALG